MADELRDLALRVLTADSLDEKLRAWPRDLSDLAPGLALCVLQPTRPANLQFAGRKQAPPMPKPPSLRLPEKRAIAHHIMANHELQAVEVMAWTLLAFPEAPPDFRRGIARILQDEQRHTRLHLQRAADLGTPFGSLPVNGYIWKQTAQWKTLLDYIANLPLVFEARNLDHSLELADAFAAAGDELSRDVMQAIHHDEIQHVAFGWHWLTTLKPADVSEWDAFRSHLHWPMQPEKSRGIVFQSAARRAAGMSEEFLRHLDPKETS